MSLVKFLSENVSLKEETYGYIYKITNLINNKSYIGKTNKENKCRWDGTLKGAKIYNKHLQNSMNKYGVDNFKIDIIDSTKDENELNKKEIYWIAFYNTIDQNYGYNKTYGGDGAKLTEETKKKISETILRRKERYGYIHSPETRKKMSESHKGKKPMLGKHHSEETRKKISDANRGKKHPNYGKHLSKEMRKKISEGQIRRKERDGYIHSPKTRKKISDANNGKHHSDKTKKKISETLKGRHLSEATRKKMRESQQRRRFLEKKLN